MTLEDSVLVHQVCILHKLAKLVMNVEDVKKLTVEVGQITVPVPAAKLLHGQLSLQMLPVCRN